MRVAQLVEPRSFQLLRRSVPEPGPGQIVFRVSGCGVCGSNLPPWEGLEGLDYPLEPGAPGHEAWGVVEAVGEGADLDAGQPVAAISHRAFAEYDLAEASAVLPLPAALEGRPVPGEPLACAVNVVRRSGVEEGDVVVVLGIGFLGALVVSLLRDRGASRIVAVSRRTIAHEKAEAMGADDVLAWDEVSGRVDELTRGDGADVVIEATGAPGPLDLAGELCRTRGRLVVAGYHQDGRRSIDMRLWNWKGLDVVNAHERDPAVYVDGMREGIARVAAGTLELEPLLTHTLPLSRIGEAFLAAARRDPSFFKAVVVPEYAA